MARAGGRRRLRSIVALVVVVVAGAGFVYVANQEPREVFCTLGMPIVQRGQMTFTLEDGGEPGPGDCDGSKVLRGMHVLGFDCKLRAPGGDVVAELEPNRADGGCGLPDDGSSFPESWHSA